MLGNVCIFATFRHACDHFSYWYNTCSDPFISLFYYYGSFHIVFFPLNRLRLYMICTHSLLSFRSVGSYSSTSNLFGTPMFINAGYGSITYQDLYDAALSKMRFVQPNVKWSMFEEKFFRTWASQWLTRFNVQRYFLISNTVTNISVENLRALITKCDWVAREQTFQPFRCQFFRRFSLDE